MNTMIRGAIALTLCAFALGGCASTSGMDLKTPVDGFATAATAAQTTLQSYDQILDATIYEANTTRALGGKGFVSRVDPGDCINPGKASELGHCRLSLEINGQKFPLTSQPADPIAREIMAGIVTYAANLQTIATLDTEGPVKSAMTSTLANITTLSQDIDTATAKPGSGVAPSSITAALTAYSGPVSDAAGFALGAYLDSVKLKALREATTQMDKVLGPMLDVCRQSVEAGLKIQRDKYFAAYTPPMMLTITTARHLQNSKRSRATPPLTTQRSRFRRFPSSTISKRPMPR